MARQNMARYAVRAAALAAFLAAPAVHAQSCLAPTTRPPETVTQRIKIQMCGGNPSKRYQSDGVAECVHSHELDHIYPLCLCGDPLDPTNLQLQPWVEAEVKDKAENSACRWYWHGPKTDARLDRARDVVANWRERD